MSVNQGQRNRYVNLKLEYYTVTSGTSYSFPEADSNELQRQRLSQFENHRINFSGAGTPTLEYILSPSDTTWKTVTPPTDWTTTETLILSGMYQYKITAAGGDVIVDIKSY